MNNFDNDINILIEDKRLSGYKYERYSSMITNFKKFVLLYPKSNNTLDKELVEAWIFSVRNKKSNTLICYKSFIRQLAISMNKYGKKAYILPSYEIKKKTNYIPHIYSNRELKSFFKESYNLENSKYYPLKNIMFPVAYKLAYCCGLRNSEIRNIKLEDINLKEKNITIKNSKNRNDRVIYYNDELSEEIENIYINNTGISDYLFYDHLGNKLYDSVLIKNFRKVWKNLGINALERHYRIHDFRHTFAVNNLIKVYKEGKDCNSFLPILMFYMGHINIKSTEYYLRLTSTIMPTINEKVKENIGDIIPTLDGNLYE